MMTTTNVLPIGSYHFDKTDRLFLDANVWLYVYGPLPPSGDWRAREYSKALKRMREARSKIHLDVLVLSEFLNSYARRLHKQLPATDKPDFKDWRRTQDFQNAAGEMATSAKRIVGQCIRCESHFPEVDMAELLSVFAAGDSDFNDQLIAELCKQEDFTLITHDPDFRGSGVTILTANSRLLET